MPGLFHHYTTWIVLLGGVEKRELQERTEIYNSLSLFLSVLSGFFFSFPDPLSFFFDTLLCLVSLALFLCNLQSLSLPHFCSLLVPYHWNYCFGFAVVWSGAHVCVCVCDIWLSLGEMLSSSGLHTDGLTGVKCWKTNTAHHKHACIREPPVVIMMNIVCM